VCSSDLKWRIENEPTNILVNIWHEGYIPIEGTCDIIKALKNKGYEILYFSGSTKDRVDFLENKYHFKQYFDNGIFSFSIYSRKPALESYQQILKTASNIPQYCIYIDNQEKYLIPARQLGMGTILFTTSSSLLITLNDLNIL
jgi:HAD superfamily hydrolase (TIGR01509 family)